MIKKPLIGALVVEKNGYNYLMAKHLAYILDLELEVLPIPNYDDFFELDGIIDERIYTDETFTYTPTLIKDYEIYCDNISILPWRGQILS